MLSVKEVSELFEVTPQTIRVWDLKGYIKADRVSPTGRRFYSEEQIDRILKGGTSNDSEDRGI